MPPLRFKGFPARRRRRKKTLANKVAKLQRTVGNPERKFIDTQLTSSSITSTPVITQLCNMAQGLTENTRVGSKVVVSGIQLKYFITQSTTKHFRLMVVQDKQTNGAIYVAGDLLADATGGDAIVSPVNRDNKNRFKVVYDKMDSVSVAGPASAMRSTFIKLNTPLRYDGNAGDITDLTSSSYSVMAISDASSTALTIFVRLFFIDA